jgi:nitrogen fixation protein NifU and related proteins
MADMYSQKVMELFRNPHNMKEIKKASGIGKVGNPVCGDLMWVYIKVDKNKEGKEYIKDIGVKTFGCVAAIATSSMITDLAKGKTLDEALRLTRTDVASSLGGLPPIKMHCSNLSADGLHRAIEDYYSKKNAPAKKPAEKKRTQKKPVKGGRRK